VCVVGCIAVVGMCMACKLYKLGPAVDALSVPASISGRGLHLALLRTACLSAAAGLAN
jgi:hypothetical protein